MTFGLRRRGSLKGSGVQLSFFNIILYGISKRWIQHGKSAPRAHIRLQKLRRQFPRYFISQYSVTQ